MSEPKHGHDWINPLPTNGRAGQPTEHNGERGNDDVLGREGKSSQWPRTLFVVELYNSVDMPMSTDQAHKRPRIHEKLLLSYISK